MDITNHNTYLDSVLLAKANQLGSFARLAKQLSLSKGV